ncbi:hypothetical protein [Rheinheimera sp.]|uniref:hypothetical protein n=1 Tax=Rheinheimera sp. TaxID=1869214 RepID=UPI004047E99C
MSRSRAYCFTINNYTDEDCDQVQALDAKYVVCGKEVGDKGVPHLQGYVYFHTVKSMLQVSKLLTRAFLASAKGSSAQNQTYCSKDNLWYEKGVPPLTNKEKGVVEKDRWEAVWSAAKEGRIDDIPAKILIQNYSTIKRIKKDYMLTPEDLADGVCGLWYYGDTGTGKSWTARQENPGAFIKPVNKWWDGYTGQDCVIIDDLDDDHQGLMHYLKIWADRYAFKAEEKNGYFFIRPKKIIVTSQWTIEQICPKPQHVVALKRRFKEVDFNVPVPMDEVKRI